MPPISSLAQLSKQLSEFQLLVKEIRNSLLLSLEEAANYEIGSNALVALRVTLVPTLVRNEEREDRESAGSPTTES